MVSKADRAAEARRLLFGDDGASVTVFTPRRHGKSTLAKNLKKAGYKVSTGKEIDKPIPKKPSWRCHSCNGMNIGNIITPCLHCWTPRKGYKP